MTCFALQFRERVGSPTGFDSSLKRFTSCLKVTVSVCHASTRLLYFQSHYIPKAFQLFFQLPISYVELN